MESFYSFTYFLLFSCHSLSSSCAPAVSCVKFQLDEAVERLDLLGLITGDSLRRRKDPGTSRTRKDIFALMRREQELEKMYEQLMHRRNELRGLSNKSKYLQNQSELSEITAALKQSTSSITANLKDHPTIVGNLNKIQKDRASLNSLLQTVSDELKEENYHGSSPAQIAAAAQAQAALQAQAQAGVILLNDDGTNPLDPNSNGAGGSGAGAGAGMGAGGYTPSYSYDTLVEQVARRSEEQRLLVETKLRQEKTSEALKKLEIELENEWVEFEKLEDQKNAQIIDLTNQLKHLKKVTALTVKYEQQTAIAKKETEDRLRATRIGELKASIARRKAELKTDKRVNKKSLVFLAKQKDAMDALYEQWEHNYAVDHGAKSREYDELTRQRTTDQVQLVAKQNRWDEDSKAKIALMKEMATRAQEEEAYRQLMDRMYLAQCTIRFYWKVYWRKRLKELKKLKKKKLARLRAKRLAEKNRPFGERNNKSDAASDGEASGGEGLGGGGATGSVAASKPGSAGPASKMGSAPGSAKPSAR